MWCIRGTIAPPGGASASGTTILPILVQEGTVSVYAASASTRPWPVNAVGAGRSYYYYYVSTAGR